MQKEIANLQSAHSLVSGIWCGLTINSAVEMKVRRIRQYLQDRLDIIYMLTENHLED